MTQPSIIRLELPTQGFSFQDMESSMIMFPFRRRNERKREGEGDRWREREEERVTKGRVPLSNDARALFYELHLARPSLSALSLTKPQTINEKKYFFFLYPISLFMNQFGISMSTIPDRQLYFYIQSQLHCDFLYEIKSAS